MLTDAGRTAHCLLMKDFFLLYIMKWSIDQLQMDLTVFTLHALEQTFTTTISFSLGQNPDSSGW